MKSLQQVTSEVVGCTQCDLHRAYHGPVPARLTHDAKPQVFIVGEAPGDKEDLAKKPFLGPSGMKLARWLELAGVGPAFITNTVKCRPPKNKDPDAPWIAACAGHLLAELEAVQPRLILCVGRFAGNAILAADYTMAELYSVNGRATRTIAAGTPVPVVSIYHPASFMYGHKAVTEADNIDTIRAGLKRAGLA